jgi:hypothetical protein
VSADLGLCAQILPVSGAHKDDRRDLGTAFDLVEHEIFASDEAVSLYDRLPLGLDRDPLEDWLGFNTISKGSLI